MSKANRFHRKYDWKAPVCKLPDFLGNIPTRQQRRALRRKLAFQSITERFGGELRSKRREMAFILAKRKQP